MISRILAGAMVAVLVAFAVQSAQPAIGGGDGSPTRLIDMQGMDRSVSPGEDFWRYANGGFLRDAGIPDDLQAIGAGEQVRREMDRRMLALFESPLDAGSRTKGSRQARQLYSAYLDRQRRDADGARPLEEDLRQLQAITGKDELARFLSLRDGLRALPFELAIGTNYREPTSTVLTVRQGGLGMSQHHYSGVNDKVPEYVGYLARLFSHAGYGEPSETAARAAASVESRFSGDWMSVLELRSLQQHFLVIPIGQLASEAPGFPWQQILIDAGLEADDHVAVMGLASVAALSRSWLELPLSDLKHWAAARIIDRAAPYLSEAFVEAHHQFHDVQLRGLAARGAERADALSLAGRLLPFAVGRMYVDRHFDPETKRQVEAMVGHVRNAMARRIAAADWLSQATRERSLTKLHNLHVEVGHPLHWPDFSGLDVDGLALVEAIRRTHAFNWQQQVAGLSQPRDPDAGSMPPHWVSAGFTGGGVVFAAGILQPPYFDPNAPPEVNYGAIGATIGHEITHAFDDSQRVFDETGSLAEADWWTAEDIAAFGARANPLATWFERYEPLPGRHINGAQTLGENLADLGGLSIAYEAWRESLGGEEPPVVDGLTGDQRFFIAYAQQWRSKVRPEYLERQLATDVHSPAEWRVNGIVRHLPEWRRAFDVRPGMAMHEADEDLIKVW